ncbi:hypothetical protein COEREDRAFT_80375 [Coemansia reversa NRRL 1564]|uniref:Uncharacterized protein n=1 Tax=Coemansia reversa (strain ATCC 12441 / NRRL 1564) TaxID=763665 RepID=A0A2G5BFB0_COERN|nr:hypothetical protein COEREDRAFT_80375 [Coemansia reversa NRRL 1564]|eukprot:PIA17699.1 hypothetical protein COEREDRAFT_80375 [Coemansia reversa NRRL 1564]
MEKPQHTIFVPEYVNVDDLDKCLQDRVTEFVPIDSKTFDPNAQLKDCAKFIVLEKDYFSAYIGDSAPLKCNYQSRNALMCFMRFNLNASHFNHSFVKIDGLMCKSQLPVHYFVYSKDADCLNQFNITENNTIVEYFEDDEDEDLNKFASIVKGKHACMGSFFIVNKGFDYRAVDVDDVKNIYSFTRVLKYSAISCLAEGTKTIQQLIEEEILRKKERRPNPERLSDFKLRDIDGNEVMDKEKFALEIPRDDDDNTEDGEESADTDNHGVEGIYEGKDWVNINSYMQDGNDHFLSAHPDGGEIFHCVTIDNICYLKCGDKYLYTDPDHEMDYIFVNNGIPTKEKCVQIHYMNDGTIALTRWGGNVFYNCEWVKCSYGAIGLNSDNEELYWREPMKLRIIRL